MEELNKFKDALKEKVSLLKAKLNGCRKSEEEKDAVAKIAVKDYQEKKSDLDDLEKEVEETSESIQQEQQNAADANSGNKKAAINSLLNDLEERLEKLKKDVVKVKEEVLEYVDEVNNPDVAPVSYKLEFKVHIFNVQLYQFVLISETKFYFVICLHLSNTMYCNKIQTKHSFKLSIQLTQYNYFPCAYR